MMWAQFLNLLKRCFCCHERWHEPLYHKCLTYPWQTEWACNRCDKRIVRDNFHPPVQRRLDAQIQNW